MIKHNRFHISNIFGFTILELLISITVSLSIIAATYQLFHSQNTSYNKQDQIVETQQNLRAVVAIISKELQIAGYDPQGRAGAGIVEEFSPPHDVLNIDYNYDKSIIGFTIDSNGDAYINPQDGEMIAYRINNKSLERYNSKIDQWEILSENIDALNFVYLDQEGNRTYDIKEFKAVEITILAKTNKKDIKYNNSVIYKNKQGEIICIDCTNDSHHRRLVSTTLEFRNLNL